MGTTYAYPIYKKEDQFNILKDEKEKYTELKLKENPEYKYDQFEHKWDKYISKINDYVSNDSFERNIKVLGITDYWSIDNYEHLVSIKNKLSSKIELILPNVELRLSISGKKSPINIHCIWFCCKVFQKIYFSVKLRKKTVKIIRT
ncbi:MULTISPECIES: hypothetical protein [Lactococcus]|uniref:hypothetical protein n=1 Tax=Lactococcus TaxID=1357 RepID=UPI0032427DB8